MLLNNIAVQFSVHLQFPTNCQGSQRNSNGKAGNFKKRFNSEGGKKTDGGLS